jgi:hypothetical protein
MECPMCHLSNHPSDSGYCKESGTQLAVVGDIRASLTKIFVSPPIYKQLGNMEICYK